MLLSHFERFPQGCQLNIDGAIGCTLGFPPDQVGRDYCRVNIEQLLAVKVPIEVLQPKTCFPWITAPMGAVVGHQTNGRTFPGLFCGSRAFPFGNLALILL